MNHTNEPDDSVKRPVEYWLGDAFIDLRIAQKERAKQEKISPVTDEFIDRELHEIVTRLDRIYSEYMKLYRPNV